jgi:hypothetical protein
MRRTGAPQPSRYLQLLNLRITVGCKIINMLCHSTADFDELSAESNRVDEVLEQFRRYVRDYERVVAAEQRRFHVPGLTRPGNDHEQPCAFCNAAEATSASDILEALSVVRAA